MSRENKNYFMPQDINNSSFPKAFNITVLSDDDDSSLEIVPLDSILAPEDPNNLGALKENKKSKTLMEDNSVKKALAEISFIEASEVLEKGDLQSAIAKYKEAISYVSDNPDYYIKLMEALSKDVKHKPELEALEKSVIKIFHNEEKIKAKLEQLHPIPKTKTLDKVAKDSKTSAKILTEPRKSLKEPEQTKTLSKFARTLDSNKNQQTNSKTPKTAKMVRLKNNVYVLTEGVKKQNPYVKVITLFFLILMPIGILWGLNQSYKETIIETIPISPDSQSSLLESELYFCWVSSTDKVDYLFQIEQEGKPVLERYTRENFYLVSKEDAKLVKKNIYSTWRAIPISPKREVLKYKTSEAQFIVINK